jgi:hypothetical protein
VISFEMRIKKLKKTSRYCPTMYKNKPGKLLMNLRTSMDDQNTIFSIFI